MHLFSFTAKALGDFFLFYADFLMLHKLGAVDKKLKKKAALGGEWTGNFEGEKGISMKSEWDYRLRRGGIIICSRNGREMEGNLRHPLLMNDG